MAHAESGGPIVFDQPVDLLQRLLVAQYVRLNAIVACRIRDDFNERAAAMLSRGMREGTIHRAVSCTLDGLLRHGNNWIDGSAASRFRSSTFLRRMRNEP